MIDKQPLRWYEHLWMAVLIGVILVCLWMLSGCGDKANVRIEYVEKKVPVQVALDPRLTTPPPMPADPPFRCRDATGAATVCEQDKEDWIDALVKTAADAINQIKEIAGLQPGAQK